MQHDVLLRSDFSEFTYLHQMMIGHNGQKFGEKKCNSFSSEAKIDLFEEKKFQPSITTIFITLFQIFLAHCVRCVCVLIRQIKAVPSPVTPCICI